jgi:hypothetical protein
MHGGKRPGAGRPKGSATKKTRAIANAAAAEGITPLEVMLEAMRAHHEAGRLDEAAAVAKDAAPYIHPRLASIDQNVSGFPGYEPIPIPVAERDSLDPAERAASGRDLR